MAKEFEKINGSKKITPEFRFDASQVPALLAFKFFYRRLRYLLSFEKPEIQTSAEPFYTTPPTQTTVPASVFETPPPSTNPINPQYSSSSNATSASAESKDEAASDSCANDFVHATFDLLEDSLDQMAWYKGTKYAFQETCLPPAITLILEPGKKWNLS